MFVIGYVLVLSADCFLHSFSLGLLSSKYGNGFCTITLPWCYIIPQTCILNVLSHLLKAILSVTYLDDQPYDWNTKVY